MTANSGAARRRPATLWWSLLMLGVLAGAGCRADVRLRGDAPDRLVAGPQGGVGQFVVECGLDQLRPDDPIVHPGHAGASHLHQFFGAVDVTASSNDDALRAGATTCEQHADTASYWAPVLIGDGQLITAERAVAYYRAGPDVDPLEVIEYPAGMMLVAGDATAVDPQPLSVVAWSCGAGARRHPEPPDCGDGDPLRMVVTFPDCWNGVDLAAEDWSDPTHRHTGYSTAGECPPALPFHIPQLQLAIEYPPPAGASEWALTSGDIHSGHADFWNTWDQDKLRREVASCIRRDLVCNVSG